MSANASAGEPEADREVIIARTYDAPARLLFEAWSKDWTAFQKANEVEPIVASLSGGRR